MTTLIILHNKTNSQQCIGKPPRIQQSVGLSFYACTDGNMPVPRDIARSSEGLESLVASPLLSPCRASSINEPKTSGVVLGDINPGFFEDAIADLDHDG